MSSGLVPETLPKRLLEKFPEKFSEKLSVKMHIPDFKRKNAGLAINGLAAICLLFSSLASADSLSVGRDMIRNMSTAMQGLNYSGSFIYAHGDELESMQIFHSNVDGIEREKLISLNGEAREIVRNAESVICIWPGSKSVVVSETTPRTPFPAFEPYQLAQLEKLYAFNHVGMDRVAGRKVEVVDIKPLDSYRYGYQLWIDAETFLMLRSVMRDNSGAIVEQVMFTDVEYADDIPSSFFNPSTEGERQEWMVDFDKPLLPAEPISGIPGVDQLSVPAGFEVMSDKVLVLPGDSTVRRVMYSDGLASLSVFVAPSGGNTQNELLGISGMGAVHAYGVMEDKWHVTVVGEVPKPTVMMMGDSLKLAER